MLINWLPYVATLLKLELPSAWDEVCDWSDLHGSIANADLCRIAKVNTLKASKMLAAWREQGVVVPLPERAKRNMAYTKPIQPEREPDLLSNSQENKPDRGSAYRLLRFPPMPRQRNPRRPGLGHGAVAGRL